jgi:hypothetical protein
MLSASIARYLLATFRPYFSHAPSKRIMKSG